MSDRHEHERVDWKIHGVKVIPGDQLDPNTAQTPGMDRAAAINLARVGAQKIWAGTVKIHANAKTGAHPHGHLEGVALNIATEPVERPEEVRWIDPIHRHG